MRLLLIFPIVLFFNSCSTSLQSENDSAYVLKSSIPEYEKSLVINEYAPKSLQVNEFGEKADWVELYNTTDSDITMVAGEWTLTDDRSNPGKYVLPEIVVKSHAYLLIWCDDNRSSSDQLHAPFKLSPNGEEVLLFWNRELVDFISYNDQVKKGRSYGRTNDGGTDWQKFDTPSPGKTNNLLNNYAESLK